MPFQDLNTAESSTSMTNDDTGRHLVSMEQPTPDVSDHPDISPRHAQISSSRPTAPQDTIAYNGSSIRAIRYEDTLEELTENGGPQTSPNSNSLQRYRARRIAMRSEARAEVTLSHIPEGFDTEQQSTSSRLESKTPKKDSPTFASKRNSISGSFNSLKRAGTKLVRRGIQGVLPVTPNKKSDSAPIKTPDAREDVSNNGNQIATPAHASEPLSYDDLYDAPPRNDIAGPTTIREETRPSHGQNESDNTERTFYDAQEALTPAINLTAVNLPTTTAAEVSEANNNTSQRQYPSRTSSRAAAIIAQEQYPTRVSSLENIVTRINRRESVTTLSENVGYAALSSRRNSRLSFTSSQGLREAGLHETSDHTNADNGQNISREIEISSQMIMDAVQDSSKENEAREQAIQAETVGAPESLLDLVKEHLGQPDDNIPTTINKLPNVVRVSTQDVKFKNAHKNFFPSWAQGIKRNGRPYTQEEVVNIVTGST